MAAGSSSSMSSSSLVPAPQIYWQPDVSGFVRQKDAFARVHAVDWENGIAHRIANFGGVECLQERWNAHQAEILPIAVQLCTYSRLHPASACIQAIVVHEVINNGTCMGKKLGGEFPTFDHLGELLPCRMDYSSHTRNVYLELPGVRPLFVRDRMRALLPYKTDVLTKVVLSLRVSTEVTELVANKRIFCRDNNSSVRAAREASALMALKGTPHVIQLLESRKIESDDISVVDLWTELATGRRVHWSRMKKLPLALRWQLYSNFLEALAAVHAQKRIHGGLCIDNVWMTGGHDADGNEVLKVRLGGFGQTKQMTTDAPRVGWYRNKYGAPEVYRRNDHHTLILAEHDLEGWQKIEVWAAAFVGLKAFGGFIFQSVSELGSLPWQAFDQRLPEREVFTKNIPDPIQPVLRGMLQHDPADRSTIQQALDGIRAALPLV